MQAEEDPTPSTRTGTRALRTRTHWMMPVNGRENCTPSSEKVSQMNGSSDIYYDIYLCILVHTLLHIPSCMFSGILQHLSYKHSQEWRYGCLSDLGGSLAGEEVLCSSVTHDLPLIANMGGRCVVGGGGGRLEFCCGGRSIWRLLEAG